MSDFPPLLTPGGSRGVLSPHGDGTMFADMITCNRTAYSSTATTWTANRCVYAPVVVRSFITVTDAIVTVNTQAGNLDIGIYTWEGTKIVANGGVATAAAGVQVVTLTDTALSPGWYYMGFSCDSSSAVFRSSALGTAVARQSGCAFQQQTGTYPLPATATFAVYATALMPAMAAGYRSAV